MGQIISPDDMVEQECIKEVNNVLNKYGCRMMPKCVIDGKGVTMGIEFVRAPAAGPVLGTGKGPMSIGSRVGGSNG